MSVENLQEQPEMQHRETTPFETNTFTITHLSDSPEGFNVTTFYSGPKLEPGTKAPLTPQQKDALRTDMQGEMNFTGGNAAAEALNAYREAVDAGQSKEETETLRQAYLEKRNTYVTRSAPKARVDGMTQIGNTLRIDHLASTVFPVFKRFSKPGADPELLRFSNVSATAMALVTEDGRLIVQHRNPNNELYGDMVGASVAGYNDGKKHKLFDISDTDWGSDERKYKDFKNKQKAGTIQPVTTQSLKDNVLKEAGEEVGLEPEDFESATLSGVAEDHMQPHIEYMFLGKTKLTAEQMKAKARNAARNRRLSEEEFNEKFVDIPATPDAIKTLLTEVKNPLPPTHTAVFVSAGYAMVLKDQGLEAAKAWKREMQAGVTQNYQDIDRIVREHYESNPGSVDTVPQRMLNTIYNRQIPNFLKQRPEATEDEIKAQADALIAKLPKRNPNGYNPAFTPEEQGLPGFDQALSEAGLLPAA